MATSRGLDRLRSMAALYGHIGEFVETQEEWRQYAERIQHYFAANGVTDAERKRAIFLSVIGPRTYKLLSSLVAPSKPGEKTYDELVVALTEHHSPAPSEIVQRFKFMAYNSRFRHAGESVATYVAELGSIAQTCNYGTSLDEMLRDRIVCGINDDRIQQRLLSEKGLTYKKALELSQGLERAAKNVRELQSTKLEPAQVHKVTPGRRGGVQTRLAWLEGVSDVGTQLILPPTALLRLHGVIIVALWGTLGRPAGNQRTLVGVDKRGLRETRL